MADYLKKKINSFREQINLSEETIKTLETRIKDIQNYIKEKEQQIKVLEEAQSIIKKDETTDKSLIRLKASGRKPQSKILKNISVKQATIEILKANMEKVWTTHEIAEELLRKEGENPDNVPKKLLNVVSNAISQLYKINFVLVVKTKGKTYYWKCNEDY